MQEPLSPATWSSRWTCILDPALALTPQGLLVAKHLRRVVNLWLGREFRHIVQNSRVYRDNLALLTLAPGAAPQTLGGVSAQQQIHWSLLAWEQYLQRHNLLDLGLFWLGDRPQESVLPPDQPPHLLWQWEALAQSFDQYRPPDHSLEPDQAHPLHQAFRDALTLAALLESALILTIPPADDPHATPALCQQIERWQLPCTPLPATHPSIRWERQTLHQLFTQAGLTALLWQRPSLAIIHVYSPYAGLLTAHNGPAGQPVKDYATPPLSARLPVAHPWVETQVFWYLLS